MSERQQLWEKWLLFSQRIENIRSIVQNPGVIPHTEALEWVMEGDNIEHELEALMDETFSHLLKGTPE